MVDVERLRGNVESVRERIGRAAERAGRAAGDVRLLAVTKTVNAETVEALHEIGLRDFGENRAQVASPKLEELAKRDGPLPDDARWHFIGHLQRNKVRQVLPAFREIHSLDSERLAREIAKRVEPGGTPVDVYVELKTSDEESKLGAGEDEARRIVETAAAMPELDVRGLMTMAPWSEDPESARPFFVALHETRDRLADTTGLALPELSMGMSNDFEIAVEEGATVVRVGSALFEGLRDANIE